MIITKANRSELVYVLFVFRCHEYRAVLSASGHVAAGGHHERTETTVWCSCPRRPSLRGGRQRRTQDPEHCGVLQSAQQNLECHASHVHTQARLRLAPVFVWIWVINSHYKLIGALVPVGTVLQGVPVCCYVFRNVCLCVCGRWGMKTTHLAAQMFRQINLGCMRVSACC